MRGTTGCGLFTRRGKYKRYAGHGYLRTGGTTRITGRARGLLGSSPGLIITHPCCKDHGSVTLRGLSGGKRRVGRLSCGISTERFPGTPRTPGGRQFARPGRCRRTMRAFRHEGRRCTQGIRRLNHVGRRNEVGACMEMKRARPRLYCIRVGEGRATPIAVKALRRESGHFGRLSVRGAITSAGGVIHRGSCPRDPFARCRSNVICFTVLTRLREERFPLFNVGSRPFTLSRGRQVGVITGLASTRGAMVGQSFVDRFLYRGNRKSGGTSGLLESFTGVRFPSQCKLTETARRRRCRGQRRHLRREVGRVGGTRGGTTGRTRGRRTTRGARGGAATPGARGPRDKGTTWSRTRGIYQGRRPTRLFRHPRRGEKRNQAPPPAPPPWGLWGSRCVGCVEVSPGIRCSASESFFLRGRVIYVMNERNAGFYDLVRGHLFVHSRDHRVDGQVRVRVVCRVRRSVYHLHCNNRPIR